MKGLKLFIDEEIYFNFFELYEAGDKNEEIDINGI